MSGRGVLGKVQTTEEKKTEDWSMECEDSSTSWEVGKFEEEKKRINKLDVMGISEVRWEQSGEY